MALLNEQAEQEKSHKDRELKETKETHQSQVNDLQEKIRSLVQRHVLIIQITGKRIHCDSLCCWFIRVFQEKAVKEGETLAEELKASQQSSVSQASELHAKEVELLQNQVDKLEQELSSSKVKSEALEKSVSELQAYKEQAQVK